MESWVYRHLKPDKAACACLPLVSVSVHCESGAPKSRNRVLIAVRGPSTGEFCDSDKVDSSSTQLLFIWKIKRELFTGISWYRTANAQSSQHLIPNFFCKCDKTNCWTIACVLKESCSGQVNCWQMCFRDKSLNTGNMLNISSGRWQNSTVFAAGNGGWRKWKLARKVLQVLSTS